METWPAQLITWPTFELCTSEIQIYSISTTSTWSVPTVSWSLTFRSPSIKICIALPSWPLHIWMEHGQFYLWRLLSSGKWHHVVQWIYVSDLRESVAPNFSIREDGVRTRRILAHIYQTAEHHITKDRIFKVSVMRILNLATLHFIETGSMNLETWLNVQVNEHSWKPHCHRLYNNLY